LGILTGALHLFLQKKTYIFAYIRLKIKPMKKSILMVLLCAIVQIGFAQDKVEQYCEVIVNGKTFSSQITATIIYGRTSLIISSNVPKEKKDFDTLTDALNYMGALGWKLVSRDRKGLRDDDYWSFIFKKDLVRTEEKPADTKSTN
jgi:hypothetical protein